MIRAWWAALRADNAQRRAELRADDERRILGALRHGGETDTYDLWIRTGLRGGRLEPALARLVAVGRIQTRMTDWGPRHPGRRTPPRRVYWDPTGRPPDPPRSSPSGVSPSGRGGPTP